MKNVKNKAIKRMITRFSAGWLLAGMLLSGSSGMVLCIGEEGHFAVEPAHHGHCDRTSNTDDGTHPEATLADASHAVNRADECVDVPLGPDNMLYIAKNVRYDSLPKHKVAKDFLAGYLSLTYPEDHGIQKLACGASPRPAPALLAQRTIVLLI